MGGRMARGSSLSDDQVIAKINKDFIAVDNNISDQGWPADTPALVPWHHWLDNHPGNATNGFTTSVVITPDGTLPLGTSGSGYISEWHSSICYDPVKYLTFLNGAAEKFQKYGAIVQEPDAIKRSQMVQQFMQTVMLENRSRNHPEASNK